MADIYEMVEIYEKNWHESEKKEERIKAKISSLLKRLSELKKNKKEKTDEFEKKQSEFRNQAVDRLEEKIRHERKNGSKPLEAAIEDDSAIKAVLDEMEANRKEYETFCNKIDMEMKPIEAPLEKLHKDAWEQRKITEDSFEQYMEYLDKAYGDGNSSNSYSSYSYRTQELSSSNDAAEYEEVLKRDREARFKHDEEMRKQEERARKEEAERRRIEDVRAQHAQRRRDLEEVWARRKQEHAALDKCSHCVNSAKCSITAKYNSLNCGAYRPR